MSNATEGDILGNFGDLVGVGVVDKANGHLLVTQDSPLGMNIQVAGGIVYVPNASYNQLDSDTPKFYPVVCEPEALAIDNNVSGQTRNDIVCVKVDKSIMPDADASNIATKVIVKGTPGGGTPTTPANHYKLAEIEVVNGETEIENSMITDTREQITLQERLINLTASSTTNITGLVGGDGTNIEQVTKPTGDIVGTTDTQTLTNKTLTAPAISSPTVSGAWDGWISAGETWTYASATTFTISGDKTDKYQKGDKIKLTQTTVKYFYIIGVSESGGTTTITVTGGSDYTLANASITSPFYSKIENPQGFPDSFAYTPTWQGGSPSPSIGSGSLVGRFKMLGSMCFVDIQMVMAANTTYGDREWSWVIPVPPLYLTGGNCSALDAGTAYYLGGVRMSDSNITVTGNNLGTAFSSASPFTWATNDTLRIGFSYIF